MGIRIFHRDEAGFLMKVIAEDARLVVWPGVGAETANMNYVDMQPGEENVRHVHNRSEDTIYILDGRGTIQDYDNDRCLQFEAGQVLHVPVGVEHAVRADRGSRIESVGGPCPADYDLLRLAGAITDDGDIASTQEDVT